MADKDQEQPAKAPRRPMIGGLWRGFLHMAGGLTAGAAIAFGLLAWQLSRGPITLSFLTPYIEDAINTRSADLRVQLGDTILTWAGWQRALDIRVLDVQAFDGEGAMIALIPEVSFSLSARALFLEGAIQPRSVELFGPRLVLRRNADGSVEVDLGGDLPGPTARPGQGGRNLGRGLVDMLLAPPTPKSPVAYLQRLNVIGAETVIEDHVLARSWVAPVADIRLTRDADGISGEIVLQMELGGRQTEVVTQGIYRVEDRQLELSIDFKELDPRTLAEFHPALKNFEILEMPLKGIVTVGMSIDEAPQEIGFRLTGANGVVRTPAPFADAVAVETLEVAGFFNGTTGTLELHEFALVAKPGATLALPGAPEAESHRLPVSRIDFAGKYSLRDERLEIDRLDVRSGGPSLTLKGVVEDLTRRTVAHLDVGLRDVDLRDVGRYWAPDWGPDVRAWWLPNVTAGQVPRLDMNVRMTREAGGWTVGSVVGNMDIRGATVTYLEGLPAATDLDGQANFTQKRFDVFIDRGTSAGLNLSEGQVFVTGLGIDKEHAEIHATASGSLDKALALIDHAPLGYAKKMGVNPAKTAGNAKVRLNVAFPLILDLALKDVEISAEARLRGASVPQALHGFDLKDADLALSVDKRGMEVKGSGEVAGMPANLTWRENFGDKVPFRTLLDLSGRVPDVRKIKELGINVGPLDEQYVEGAVKADVRFTVLNDRETQVEVRADLADAKVMIDRLKWQKPYGAAGRAEMNLQFLGGKVRRITHFALYAEDMAVAGRVQFEDDGAGIQRIDFNQVSHGRTNMKGALIRRADGAWDVGFHGAGLDLTPVWEELKDSDTGDRIANFVVAAEFERVWLDPERVLHNVSATFAKNGDIWRTILLKASVNGEAPLNVSLRPGPDGNRKLDVSAADAGQVLRTIGIYDNMKGGILSISGRFEDNRPDRPLTGRLSVSDYRIMKAPVLAQVLSVMALTGILDVLQGDGLGFSELDIPFVKRAGVVEIKDARASGTSLGFTASGVLYTHADVVDLEGTVVPAYALNSLLGKIPIVGGLLSGGEKGSGLFAANFRMSGPQENPKVSVNPLSALAPGILRRVFGVFGDSPPEPSDDPGSFLTTQ